jgi:thymidylate synthase (FAD)
MKLIKPSFEIWEQKPALEGVYKQIERAGRVCYKSEDKITKNSAKEFVDRMIASGHGAMLEHGTVYLMTKTKLVNYYIHPEDGECEEYNPLEKYYQNKYSYINDDDTNLYVTTNLRVLIENGWLDDLQYICEPTEHHEKRVTVKFTCDRGVSHEFVRHRVFSFAQESTRYCNYSKDKFGNECTFIIPNWSEISEGVYECFEDSPDTYDFRARNIDNTNILYCKENVGDASIYWLKAMDNAQEIYFELLDKGWKPQQARAVLPNALKTELVMTGFVSDWEHFFELRDSKSAHPQAYELAHPLHEEFIMLGYIKQ